MTESNTRLTMNPTLIKELLTMSDDDFRGAWIALVGEPPAIMLCRTTMIDILLETVPCTSDRARAMTVRQSVG